MQQNAQQDQVSTMTARVDPSNKMEILHGIEEFQQASLESLQRLATAAEFVNLRQGQTLLRAGTLETHAFIVMEGALRMLAKEPFNDDLFSVERADSGRLVGVVGLLRQSACEGAIARRPSKLLSIPLSILYDLMKEDQGLRNGMQKHWSACEGASVLRERLSKAAQPPADACKWVINQLNNSKPGTTSKGETKELLSSVLVNHEKLTGAIITEEQKRKLEENSPMPLRFWLGTPTKELGNTDEEARQNGEETTNSNRKNMNEVIENTDWQPSGSLI